MLSTTGVVICLITLSNAQALQLTVETTTGLITGLINGTTPAVRQFLSIPFAQPPVNDLRWEPPKKLETNPSFKIDASRYPPSCPQFSSAVPSVYNRDIIPWIPYRYDQSPSPGESLQTSAEDCLYLSVWTPSNATNSSALPVMFFITGGGFQTNGVDVPAQIPNHWVQRTQSHIVVTINYRMNIFGFPNAPGLNDQNLGLLDQRAALEWTQENIAQFGGDPNRITMWGQSAGAFSVDYQNFAYPSDPIVTSFFAQSGSVFSRSASADVAQTNFTFVAAHFGCDTTTDTDPLLCMRNISSVDIENFIGQYGDNATLLGISQPALSFNPVADEKVVFSNYTDRYMRQAYANLPMIYSSTAMEGEALVPYPKNPEVDGPNNTAADAVTRNVFLCPAARSSQFRAQINGTTPTYRYLFSGNFTNVSPRFWMGAYHASDLAFMFGTHQDLQSPESGEGSTEKEFEVSEAMQDAVLEFARRKGYVENWKTYQEGNIVEFGNGQNVREDVSMQSVDGMCEL